VGRGEKETQASGPPEAPVPVLAGIVWSQLQKLASRGHPWLRGELPTCSRESSFWGHASGCGELHRPGGPWEAVHEGGLGHGMMLPLHQAGPGIGSGRSADTDKI